ncbi:MAG: thioredoxin family protein [Promethearchaeota archaeon]
MEKITEEFFNTGMSFNDYLDRMETEDDKKRTKRYHDRITKNFTPKQLKIDIENQLHLVVIVATWCWDCKANVPVFERIVENSPNLAIKYFIKEELQEDPIHKKLLSKINGSERIPQLLIFSKDFYFIDRWVERSTKTYQLYIEYRNRYGWEKENKDVFIREYRKAYLRMQKKIEETVIDEVHRMLRKANIISDATYRYH